MTSMQPKTGETKEFVERETLGEADDSKSKRHHHMRRAIGQTRFLSCK